MSALTGILTAFMILQAAHSYILLTANLEDVQTLAKQLAASPVVDQINKIWRRASGQLDQHLSKAHKRANDELDVEDNERDREESEHRRNRVEPYKDQSNVHRRTEVLPKSSDDDLVALGRNASLYLKSIRKMFESI